jgi:hypothetical protein
MLFLLKFLRAVNETQEPFSGVWNIAPTIGRYMIEMATHITIRKYKSIHIYTFPTHTHTHIHTYVEICTHTHAYHGIILRMLYAHGYMHAYACIPWYYAAHTCVDTHHHACIHTCMCALHVCLCASMRMRACPMHACMHHICAMCHHVDADVHACGHVCAACACIHTYMHTHTHDAYTGCSTSERGLPPDLLSSVLCCVSESQGLQEAREHLCIR